MFSHYSLWLGSIASMAWASPSRQLRWTESESTRFLDALTLADAADLPSSPSDQSIYSGTERVGFYLPELVLLDIGNDDQCHGLIFTTDGIINSDIVVIPAHCGEVGKTFDDVKVAIVNATNTKSVIGTVVATHPCYNPDLFFGDIAVLKLNQTHVDPFGNKAYGLYNRDGEIPVLNGDRLDLFGYGETILAEFPNNIHGLRVDYLRTCRATYEFYDQHTQLCVAFPSRSGPCDGDAGAPVYYTDPENPSAGNVVVGISTFTRGDLCGSPLPSGFTRLSGFYDWVFQQQCLFSSSPPASCASATFPVPNCEINSGGGGGGSSCGCCCLAIRSVKSWAHHLGMTVRSLWSS